MCESEPWELEYRRKGRLWHGAVDISPITSVLPTGSAVLDAGCGDGKTLVPLAKAGYAVTGLDISGSALDLANEELARLGLDAELVAGDVLALPFEDAAFQGVSCRHLLGHVSDSERAVAELARVLTPYMACEHAIKFKATNGRFRTKGFLLADVFSTGDFRCGEGEEIEPGTFLRGNGISTHYFTITELKELLGRWFNVEVSEIRGTIRLGGKQGVRSVLRAIGWVGKKPRLKRGFPNREPPPVTLN